MNNILVVCWIDIGAAWLLLSEAERLRFLARVKLVNPGVVSRLLPCPVMGVSQWKEQPLLDPDIETLGP